MWQRGACETHRTPHWHFPSTADGQLYTVWAWGQAGDGVSGRGALWEDSSRQGQQGQQMLVPAGGTEKSACGEGPRGPDRAESCHGSPRASSLVAPCPPSVWEELTPPAEGAEGWTRATWSTVLEVVAPGVATSRLGPWIWGRRGQGEGQGEKNELWGAQWGSCAPRGLPTHARAACPLPSSPCVRF